MATKAIFVGINKCLDQAIPELVAAKRDICWSNECRSP